MCASQSSIGFHPKTSSEIADFAESIEKKLVQKGMALSLLPSFLRGTREAMKTRRSTRLEDSENNNAKADAKAADNEKKEKPNDEESENDEEL